MKTIFTLKNDLLGFSKKMYLAALEDGAFLATYDVTEKEIEDFTADLSKIDDLHFLCESIKVALDKKKEILRQADALRTESIISDISREIAKEYKNDFDFDVFEHVYETSMQILKSKEFWG